jgi:histidine triad (HIT) family protein
MLINSPNSVIETAMTYDENNIFAKILPRTEGHALVITKEKARGLFDIKPEALARLMAVVQKLAPQIKDAMGADGVLIQQFNGAAAGQTVFHLHVHILPRKEGESLKPHAGKMEDQAKLAATADKIRKKLAS